MRRVLEACSALQLPGGFHMERVQWLYDGVATSSSGAAAGGGGGRRPHLLYWMQTSVRAKYNYALEYAIAAANALGLPLHVVYFLSDRSVVAPAARPRDLNAHGVATARHAKFTIEGLACVQRKLARRGLSFQVFHHRHHSGPEGPAATPLAFWAEHDDDELEGIDDATEDPMLTSPDPLRPTRSDLLDRCARDALLVITDRPYLRPWREALATCVDDAEANQRQWGLVQVEGDVVVPVESASPKEEYAARTIRPKITAQLKKYLVELDHVEVLEAVQSNKRPLTVGPEDAPWLVPLDVGGDPEGVLKQLDVDHSVPGVSAFLGGEDVAVELAKTFLEKKLGRYAIDRNEPSGDGGSNLSLYLRHGHVSPVRVALNAHKVKNAKDGKESFLEELIVRRELAINMCVYNAQYDTIGCLPEYAATTLRLHATDKREHLYDVAQLESGKTFDVYWNAAQLEMVHTGKMHGYMRMYWAKKILEWTKTPELGFRIALYLNNKYALDAPDPNSYTGIAWSFGKHDQGWKERPIFGKVRYMNESGLKRKFRMDAYVAKVQKLARAVTTTSNVGDVSNKSKPGQRESEKRQPEEVTVDAPRGAMTKKRKVLESQNATK